MFMVITVFAIIAFVILNAVVQIRLIWNSTVMQDSDSSWIAFMVVGITIMMLIGSYHVFDLVTSTSYIEKDLSIFGFCTLVMYGLSVILGWIYIFASKVLQYIQISSNQDNHVKVGVEVNEECSQ